jgi:pimeloyl-ACP methyl ester carboxylesterase
MMRTIGLARNAAGKSSSTGRAAAPKARSLADGESRSVPFDGNKVHYVTVGEGRNTLVFVHCWAGNLGFWREQVPALADKARLVLIDLPGHGQSDKLPAVYSMDYFARAVLAVMRNARVGKATLVGHSMGGPVIYRVYEQAPEKVVALVVVDGFLRRPKVAPGQAEQFIAQFRTPDYRERIRQFFGPMFPGTEALRNRILSEMLATPQRVMSDTMEGMFGPGQPDWDLKPANVPVLVISAKGTLYDAEGENYVRSLSSQTDYRVMKNVGHWLMLERPAEFNALLTDMLRKFNLIAN